MKRFVGLGLALIILAGLFFSRFMVLSSLAHPWWHTNATLAGAGAGVVIWFVLIWLGKYTPQTAKWAERGLVVVFVIAIYITYTAGREFIDSAVFEVRAGQIWHYGYHVVVATFIIFTTHILKLLLSFVAPDKTK